MAEIKQQIEFQLNKDLAQALKNLNADKLAKDLAKIILQLILKRINDGYDIKSRKFGNYNKNYNKARAYKYASAKYGTTKYASTSERDKLRLTGNLLSSIDAKPDKIFIGAGGASIKIKVFFKDAFNELKAEGLQSTTGYTKKGRYSKKSWEFFGLAISGTYANEEKLRLQRYIINYIKAASGRVNIKIKN